MDEIFGSLFGDGAEAGLSDVVTGWLASSFGIGEKPQTSEYAYVYERYLCGGPKPRNINDA